MASHPNSDRPRIVARHRTAGAHRRGFRAAWRPRQHLLDALRGRARRAAQWPFDDAERFKWHYVPRERAGVPIEAMGEAAKAAVHDLLRHALSEVGYRKATDIMALEEPLGLIENHARHYRHPENYSVTIFGEPGRLPWGWRIEGQHLSLNFTAVTEELFGVTPVSSAPTRPRCPRATRWRAIARSAARPTCPTAHSRPERGCPRARDHRPHLARQHHHRAGREDALKERQGLPLAAMEEGSAQPRPRAARLLRQGACRHDLAARRARAHPRRRGRAMPLRLGGPLERGHANYWRLHGPISLIEYDNTQNDANHIHSVWHDLERDVGRDLLREHYAAAITPRPRLSAAARLRRQARRRRAARRAPRRS